MASACSDSDSGQLPVIDAALDVGVYDAHTSVDASPVDANKTDVDAADAADSAPACVPVPLLVGGTDVTTQGWTVSSGSAPYTLDYGADYVRLGTSTNGGATTGGQVMLSRANTIDSTRPFILRIEMQVESVATHNPYDAAAAIMASFTPPFGVGVQRNQMIFLDAAKIGWADDTQAIDVAVLGNYHTYEFSLDAANVATVKVDGVASMLTRSGFMTNGTIAIGDQTNEKNVDAAMRIRSVTRVCP